MDYRKTCIPSPGSQWRSDLSPQAGRGDPNIGTGSKKPSCSGNKKGSGSSPEPFSLTSRRTYLGSFPRFGSAIGSVRCGALLDACWFEPTFTLLMPPPPGDSTTGFGFDRIGGKVVDGRRLGGPTG